MLFISYAHEDVELANRLAARLKQSGYEFWMDREDIRTGDSWEWEIENNLRQASAVVVILTRQSIDSESYVRRELHVARNILNKRIYALTPEFIDKIPFAVADLQQIRCEDDFNRGLEELIRQLVPVEQGECTIEVPEELASQLGPGGVEYALMSRFPVTRMISVKEEITRGHSGSKVFYVTASFRNSDRPPAEHFLKINNAWSNEPRKRFEMAYKTKIQSFMPALADATPWDEDSKRIALLYGLGNAPGGYAPLDELVDKNLPHAISLIHEVGKVLAAWNDYGNYNKNLHAHELLQLALCDSLDPGSRYSRLDKNANTSILYRSAELLGLSEDIPLIDFETRYNLPNPLAYLVNDSLWREKDKKPLITFPCGKIHGDLHLRNILAIYKTSDRKSFAPSIIDFDTYDPDNLIFVDFAYLEISVISRLFGLDRESHSPENHPELERLSEYLAEAIELPDVMPELGALSVAAWNLLRPLREAAERIAQQQSDYDKAFWIARTAAGLQLMRKRKSAPHERVLALLIAADSINHLVKKNGMRPPRGTVTSLEWNREHIYS